MQLTLWPSGLRRNVKAVVLIGGGSNPLDVIFVRVRDNFVEDFLVRNNFGLPAVRKNPAQNSNFTQKSQFVEKRP